MQSIYFEAFITFFVVVDPFGILPIFLSLTREESASDRRKIALKACCIAAIVLILFAFVGDALLDTLKISVPAFKVAGGLLLLLTAINMVLASPSGIISTTREEKAEAKTRADISVFPLAIPLISGPGSLTTMVILTRQVEGSFLAQGGIVLMLLLVLVITYLCFLLVQPLSKFLGITGTNVIGRVFGIILAALAVQFMIDGLKQSFNL